MGHLHAANFEKTFAIVPRGSPPFPPSPGIGAPPASRTARWRRHVSSLAVVSTARHKFATSHALTCFGGIVFEGVSIASMHNSYDPDGTDMLPDCHDNVVAWPPSDENVDTARS